MESAEDCQTICEGVEECHDWIWNGPEHKRRPNYCWLKKAPIGYSAGRPRDMHRVSGPEYCSCWEQGVTIGRVSGNGAGMVKDVHSVAACQEACQANDECNNWVWNTPDHKKNPEKCWLKKAPIGYQKGKRMGRHRISGLKYC